jgi:chemotaxis protein histidine kinase CheA
LGLQLINMLFWICPECGRECSPAIRDCPACVGAPDGSASANGSQSVLAPAQALKTAVQEPALFAANGNSGHGTPGLAVAVDESSARGENAGPVPADEALESLVRPLVESAAARDSEPSVVAESFSIALELRAEAVLEAISARIATEEAARVQREAEEAERIQREAEEAARLQREAEEAARVQREAEEAARLQREAEEAARIQREAEEAARVQREAEEAKRLQREAEEGARVQREAEEAERLQREAEEAARIQREAEEAARAQREAEEAERLQREAEEAERLQREAEEAERLQREAEEAARVQREAEEAARLQREAEEAARLQREAEEAERLQREAEEAARLQREAEEAARLQREAEEAERLQREAEEAERLQREAEEAALLARFEAEQAAIRAVAASFEQRPTFALLCEVGETVVAPAAPSTEWIRTPRPQIRPCPPKDLNFASLAWSPATTPLAGPCLPRDLHLVDLGSVTRKPDRKGFGVPTWILSVVLATSVFLGVGALLQYLGASRDSKASPASASATAQAIPASSGTAARQDATAKFLEVAGLRVVTAWNHKQQLHYVVVNHSGSDLPGMAVRIAVRRFEAASSATPLFTVDASLPSLGPYQSKEVRTDLDSDASASAIPDWQSLRAEVEVSDGK